MNDLNSILVEGNLTKDPEGQDVSETKLCTFSIATNRYFKKGENYEQETSYFEVKCWGKLAEVCLEYLKKGRGVRVIGRIKQERWEKEGQKRNKVVIIADHIEFFKVTKREE